MLSSCFFMKQLFVVILIIDFFDWYVFLVLSFYYNKKIFILNLYCYTVQCTVKLFIYFANFVCIFIAMYGDYYICVVALPRNKTFLFTIAYSCCYYWYVFVFRRGWGTGILKY